MRTKVFKSGNSQAVRIPKEFHLDVSEVEIEQRGDEIVLRKPRQASGAIVVELLASLSKDFMKGGRKQGKMQKRPDL